MKDDLIEDYSNSPVLVLVIRDQLLVRRNELSLNSEWGCCAGHKIRYFILLIFTVYLKQHLLSYLLYYIVYMSHKTHY